MPARASALAEFYGGPVWKAHRETANETMIDSDNVLLLRPLVPSHGPVVISRPAKETIPGFPTSLIVVTVYSFRNSSADFQRFFESTLRPELVRHGVVVLATMTTETAANNFPRLPVREGETAFVWMATFDSAETWRAISTQLSSSPAWQRAQQQLQPQLKSPAQQLRLQPTRRSTLR